MMNQSKINKKDDSKMLKEEPLKKKTDRNDPPTSAKIIQFPQEKKLNWPIILLIFSFIAGVIVIKSIKPVPRITPKPIDDVLPSPTSTYRQPTKKVMPPAIIRKEETLQLGEWTFQDPKEVASLNLFNDIFYKLGTSAYGEQQKEASEKEIYLLIATTKNNNQLYTIKVPQEGMGVYYEYIHLVKTNDNKYYWLQNQYPTKSYSSNFLSDMNDYWLKEEVMIATNVIDVLNPPEELVVNGIKYDKEYELSSRSFSADEATEIENTKSGIFSKSVKQIPADNSVLESRAFILKLKDNREVVYSVNSNLFSDDSVPAITWSDKTTNTTSFVTPSGGGSCGGSMLGGDAVLKSAYNEELFKEIGATRDGETVYQIVDSTHILVKHLYEKEYSLGRNTETTDFLTLEDFAAKRNHFIWKDSTGSYIVYLSGDYAKMVECAKPVIYLYPETKTEVMVQVAANVTESDPLYPEEGWKVVAHPNGSIDYKGEVYDSLFWEGKGKGIYMDLKDQGVVVAQKELIATVYDHLNQLGLNKKESDDFVEFWKDYLPKEKYVRLTWFKTPEMDLLAPLTVSPQPDTVIRVFLEAEGMEAPVKLEPQKLSAPQREGFVLIEWGGLLIGEK